MNFIDWLRRRETCEPARAWVGSATASWETCHRGSWMEWLDDQIHFLPKRTRDEYETAKQPIREKYEAAKRVPVQAYNEATALIAVAYHRAKATWEDYEAERRLHGHAYWDAIKPHRDVYEAETADLMRDFAAWDLVKKAIENYGINL